MRTFVLGAAILIAQAASAIAADLQRPVFKAAPMIVPPWNWTGCYAGGHGGYLQGQSQDWTVETPGGAFFGQSLGSHALNSWIGGVQAGCISVRRRLCARCRGRLRLDGCGRRA